MTVCDFYIPKSSARISVDLVGHSIAGLIRTIRMHFEPANQIAGSIEVTPIVTFHEVSKWYGNVIGINKLHCAFGSGVTGLLGPNGAGKSTLLQLATGQLYPSQGTVEVLGQRVWNNAALNRYIGLCPEQDAFYEWMTGARFRANLRPAKRHAS